MKWLRRVHLYSGLFMTPWVFLYGLTAMLFNHPTWFSDRQVIEFGPAEVAGTTLAQMPRPDELAARLLEKMNAADSAAGFQFTPGSSATYAQPLTAAFQRDGKPYNLRLDLATLEGSVREGALRQRGGPTPPAERGGGERSRGNEEPATSAETPVGEARPEGRRRRNAETRPSEQGGANAQVSGNEGRADATTRPAGELRRRGGSAEARGGEGSGGESRGQPRNESRAADKQIPVAMDITALQNTDQAVLTILNKLNVAAGELSVKAAPELSFAVVGHGQNWKARYDGAGGIVTLTPATAEAAREVPTRQFLLNLHKAHGYPAAGGARWIWAIAVDAMFLAMCGWGLTGILMWWQMKNLRLIGTIILVTSAITATYMIVAMHGAMTGA